MNTPKAEGLSHDFFCSCVAQALILLISLCSLSAYADPTPDQRADQILREEQLRQKELLKQQDLRRRPPGTIDLDIKKEGPISGESAKCFDIKEIVLEGSISLTDEERRHLVEPFLNKCIGLVEIRELMRVITNFYIDKGYVTTRAYIPQQDMSTGTLKLLVVEGITGKIDLESKEAHINLGTAFPGLEGKVLNIRDFEQGLDQINRLKSNNASMELRPTGEPGKTDVLIKNQPGAPWSTSFTLDNYGSDSTGDNRGTLTLGLDSPLGINDYWFASFSHNLDSETNNHLSKSVLLNTNIPYGYWNFTGSYSKSNYESLITSPTQQYRSNGNTVTYNLGLQRVLQRGQTNKLTLSSGLTHKDTKNYIEGSLLTTSSRKLTDINVNLTAVFAALGGSWTLDGGVSRGLDWFGVEELPGAGTGTVPTAKYWKYNASGTYSRAFKVSDLSASWSSSLQMQYARDYLYGSEQISVGGLYTVRGYDGTSIAGDRGLYWRNDLALTLPPFDDATTSKWVGRLQPYLALDVGHISGREGQTEGTLAGTAIGIRSVNGLVSFDFAYGVPVSYSDSIDKKFNVENHALYLKIGIAI